MTAFSLTPSEGLTLSTLLHLPIQSGSLLCDWLAFSDVSAIPSGPDADLASLAEKGYFLAGNKDQPIPPALVRSLTLAAVNAVDISLILQRGGRSILTQFAQAGRGLMQYSLEEGRLFLHPAVDSQAFIDSLLPAWFVAEHDDGLQVEMPLAAFALFKQAAALADLASGDTLLESDTFKKKDLLKQASLMPDLTGRFNLSPAEDAPPAANEPWEEHLKRLTTAGLLRKVTAAALAVGPAGQPLAAVLSDPDVCSLTVSTQIAGQAAPLTGVFLYGAGRLFLLDAAPDRLIIRQLATRSAAFPWLQELLSKGSQPLALDLAILVA